MISIETLDKDRSYLLLLIVFYSFLSFQKEKNIFNIKYKVYKLIMACLSEEFKIILIRRYIYRTDSNQFTIPSAQVL